MSGSIEGTVGAALAIENWNLIQEKDNALLKKVLDHKANSVLSLIEGATQAPQLATTGMVGTRLHVTA